MIVFLIITGILLTVLTAGFVLFDKGDDSPKGSPRFRQGGKQ